MATTREKLVLSAVLALAFACRLDKLLETPRPPGLGVAPSRIAESADSGSGDVRAVALTVSSSQSRVLTWTAHTEAGSAWIALTDAAGSTPDTLQLLIDPRGLDPGTHRDAIILVPDSSTTPSVRVPVELRIDRVPPATGGLSVRVGTTGATPDPDGYTVSVDGGQPDPVGVNDTTTYPGLAPGSHNVVLGGLASNCSVSGAGASRNVPVTAGQVATVTFAVNCPTPAPTSGDLTVIASTSGGTPDPNGYSVTVNSQGRAIGANDSTTFTLDAGSYTVTLGDIAANCTVSGGPSRSGVSVIVGIRTRETFTITCTTPPPPTGDLTVSTITTGTSLDPDGYTITVDGGSPQAIDINASVSYPGLPTGNHAVVIAGVASTCSVSGGPSRTVNVPAGGTTTTFTITCTTPPPPTGDLTVSNTTTGGTPDPNGYVVTITGGQSRSLALGASTTFPGLAPGSYTVTLSDVASNCTVSGGPSQTVTVSSGQTATVAFSVSCPTPPPPTGDLTVSASTTGNQPDPDGYTVTVDGNQTSGLATNGTTTFFASAAGSHSVQLTGLASNCSVSNNPRTVNVPTGGTGSTTFAVDCPAPPPPPATHLDFTTDPPNPIILSTTFSVTVTALNAQGGVATGFTGTVQLTLQGPIAVGGLTGTTQVTAVNGVAQFTNLRVTGLCVGCSLVANAGGLTGATSSSFSVVLGQ